jgi:ribosomal protein S27AE
MNEDYPVYGRLSAQKLSQITGPLFDPDDDDEYDNQGNLDFYCECPHCPDGQMFIDPDNHEERLAFCTECGYVIDLEETH